MTRSWEGTSIIHVISDLKMNRGMANWGQLSASKNRRTYSSFCHKQRRECCKSNKDRTDEIKPGAKPPWSCHEKKPWGCVIIMVHVKLVTKSFFCRVRSDSGEALDTGRQMRVERVAVWKMIKNRKQISKNSSLVVEFQGFGLKIPSSGLLLLKPTKEEQSLARIVHLEMVTPVLRKNLTIFSVRWYLTRV